MDEDTRTLNHLGENADFFVDNSENLDLDVVTMEEGKIQPNPLTFSAHHGK